jgi:hypothetical protein
LGKDRRVGGVGGMNFAAAFRCRGPSFHERSPWVTGPQTASTHKPEQLPSHWFIWVYQAAWCQSAGKTDVIMPNLHFWA